MLDRQHQCASIVVYTGDKNHTVRVCKGYAGSKEDYERISSIPDEQVSLREKDVSQDMIVIFID
jgi:hypothetical protein